MYVSRPFSVVPSNRTRSYGHKQKHKKFRLNMQKTFFLLRVAEPWNSWPGSPGVSPSGDIPNAPGHIPVSHLLQVTLPWKEGWTGWSLEVLSNPNVSVILWFSELEFTLVKPPASTLFFTCSLTQVTASFTQANSFFAFKCSVSGAADTMVCKAEVQTAPKRTPVHSRYTDEC